MKKLILSSLILTLLIPITNAENISETSTRLHNEYRSEVFDATKYPLVWDETLANEATEWAEFLGENFKYSDKGQNPHAQYFKKWYHALWKDGKWENIAWGKPSMDTSKAIGLWGAEQNNYHHDTFSCEPGKVCGHYTQIIWQNTTKVWCGVAKSTTDYGGEWVVCRYEGPGNYIGQNPYIKDTNYIEDDTPDTQDADLILEDWQDDEVENTPTRTITTKETLQIYKKVNLRQDDVENKIKNWKKITDQIKELFRKLRKNKDTKTINAIKTKTWDLLTKLREKETLTRKEQTIIILVEYLFYRSYVEAEELK